LNRRSKLRALIQRGASFRTLGNWVAKTPEEQSQEKRELEDIDNEMSPTLAEMSPAINAEIRELLDSQRPLAAKQKLLDYLVADDQAEQQGKSDRKVAVPAEERMRDGFFIFMIIPLVIAFYFLFSWLSSKH